MKKIIYLILILNCLLEKSIAQIVINPKGTKINVDSSKWSLLGNNIYKKNTGNVGIGTSNPLAQLHTTLDVRFEGIGINTTNTKILTTDGSGNVTTRLFSNLLLGNAISSLNGLTVSTQTFTTGNTGTNFNISSIGSVHTFNLPDASALNRGALTTANWSTFNAKENALTFSTGLTRTVNTITVNTSQNINTLSNLTTNGLIKTSGGTGALSIATAGVDYSAGTSTLSTGILKSTTTTGNLTIAVAADFPLLNQNTTGSAATLTTARNIHGGSFNGSADVTNIITSTFGGTGNGFTKFTGPNTTEKTFTLPNASAIILTSDAAVTAIQGGTGISNYTTGDLLYASASTVLSKLNAVATGNALISGGISTAPLWGKIGLTTHVSGILPIANGGTNSSTALNNNRIIISSGNAIIEAPALSNGQLLIGSTGATPVAANITAGGGITITNAAGSITIATNASTVTQVTGTSTLTTNSSSDVSFSTPMSVTPGAGNYLVFFTGKVSNNSFGSNVIISIYNNGTRMNHTEMESTSTFSNDIQTIATNGFITNLLAGQSIEMKWRTGGGTATITNRTFIIQKLN
ncbi:MAG: hypothetical protein IPO78_10060 [Saprospiraceae bacterium]|nr:hypothetical protein [Saprospiraceae bacterium]MBK9721943.1 hypothetical protein [Saprospiraceae bacterium]